MALASHGTVTCPLALCKSRWIPWWIFRPSGRHRGGRAHHPWRQPRQGRAWHRGWGDSARFGSVRGASRCASDAAVPHSSNQNHARMTRRAHGIMGRGCSTYSSSTYYTLYTHSSTASPPPEVRAPVVRRRAGGVTCPCGTRFELGEA